MGYLINIKLEMKKRKVLRSTLPVTPLLQDFLSFFILVPGLNMLGSWIVIWKDGDKNVYTIYRKGKVVRMKVVSCKSKRKSTCASPKDVVVVWSTNKKYPSHSGWVQVSNIHGGKVTVYMKRAGPFVSFVWKRPGGYKTTATGKKYIRKFLHSNHSFK